MTKKEFLGGTPFFYKPQGSMVFFDKDSDCINYAFGINWNQYCCSVLKVNSNHVVVETVGTTSEEATNLFFKTLNT